MHEKLTVFPYGQYIVGIYVSFAFRRHSQVWGQCCGLWEICKNVTVNTRKIHVLLHGAVVRHYKCNVMAMTVWLPGVHLFCAVWAIWLVCGQM